MKRKHYGFILSALLIACSTPACLEAALESELNDIIDELYGPKAKAAAGDRLVKYLNTVHDTFDEGQDCNAVAKSLNSYCTNASQQRDADISVVVYDVEVGESTPELRKIVTAMEKLDKLDTAACSEDGVALAAFVTCIKPFLPAE